jgi:protein phosphatase
VVQDQKTTDTVHLTAQTACLRRLPGIGSAQVEVDLAALSDRGKVRPNNEDHYLVVRLDRTMQFLQTSLAPEDLPAARAETAYGLLVADGMGGRAAGEVASRTAITVLVDLVLRTPDWIMLPGEMGLQEVMRRIEQRFHRIAEALTDKALGDAGLANMGTTMTLTCSLGANLILAHVGDSRAYLFRQNQLHQLTTDQTVAQALVDAGAISPAEAATHPKRHMLTSALAANASRPWIELHHLQLEDKDQVLLCTDGLHDLVAEAALAEVLRQGRSAADTCRVLVDLALEAGGNDNVTVVLGRYRFPPQSP